MEEVLSRLNNYTCLLHMTRYAQGRREFALRKVDTVRLQVAAVGAEEFYALPGSSESVTNPRELVRTGMTGTGIFQGYAHSIFVARGLSNLQFLGADGNGERALLRYRFRLNPAAHPLEIRIGGRSAQVAAQGEFWVDQKDFLLRRVVVESADSAWSVGVQRALYIMDWAPVRTRAGSFLLPQNAEMWIFLTDGQIHRNDVTLAQCREYQAESSIRFEMDEDALEDAPGKTQAPGIAMASFLPAGITLQIALTETLRLDRLAVGDVFQAQLTRPVQQRGQMILPAGTAIEGRIRRLDRYQKPQPHTVLWLEFPFLRHEATEYTFLADLAKREPLPQLVNEIPGNSRRPAPGAEELGDYDSMGSAEPGYRSVPGVGSFVFAGEAPEIPAGYGMEWKTISPKP